MSNIKVYLRVRPEQTTTTEESDITLYSSQPSFFNISHRQKSDIFTINNSKKYFNERKFAFEKIYPQETQQHQLYNSLRERIIDCAMNGVNYCLMAYGQTSSGKTYSLFGEEKSKGIVPRFLDDIFLKLKEFKACEESSFKLRYSFFEIYKEKILDSFDEEGGNSLNIRENNGGVYIEGLGARETDSLEEITSDLQAANDKRRINETAMNGRSSRSHFVLTFEIEITNLIDYEDETGKDNKNNPKESKLLKKNYYEVTKKSKIIFVDLAGSEKQTFNRSEVLEEGCHINKSLSILNHVIMSLSKNKSADFIHYRDSKLTHFLKDIFKGSSHFAILGTVLPMHQHVNETLNTLNFVSLAKSVKTNPQINFETKNNTQIMQNQIRALLLKIDKLESEKRNEGEGDLTEQITELKDNINNFVEFVEEERRLNLPKFVSKIKDFLAFCDDYNPDEDHIDKFKEQIYDVSFKINEKRVKLKSKSKKEFGSLLTRFEKTLEHTNIQLSLLTSHNILNEDLNLLDQQKQNGKVFIKKGYKNNENLFKNIKIQQNEDMFLSHANRTISSKPRQDKTKNKITQERNGSCFLQTKSQDIEKKSFSRDISKFIKESKSSVRSLDLKKDMFLSNITKPKKSNFMRNSQFRGSYVWSNKLSENNSFYKQIIAPLNNFPEKEKKDKGVNILKRVSHREDSLLLIKEKALLKQERENLEEAKQNLLEKQEEVLKEENSLLSRKNKEIEKLKRELYLANKNNKKGKDKSEENDNEGDSRVSSKLKQVNKKILNLERQLRNRNKDYLFALKELEKVKSESRNGKMLTNSVSLKS